MSANAISVRFIPEHRERDTYVRAQLVRIAIGDWL